MGEEGEGKGVQNRKRDSGFSRCGRDLGKGGEGKGDAAAQSECRKQTLPPLLCRADHGADRGLVGALLDFPAAASSGYVWHMPPYAERGVST